MNYKDLNIFKKLFMNEIEYNKFNNRRTIAIIVLVSIVSFMVYCVVG